MSWRIGVDIGGTFTDLVAVNERNDIQLWKEDSDPEQPERAIVKGLEAVAGNLGLDVRRLLADTELFVHGSTIATNTLIERTGPTVGLICTTGFRDVIYFRDGYKWDRYNVALRRPEDFVPRHLRHGVDERILADGSIERALDDESVRRAAGRLREGGVEAIAVALLWSHVNAVHEQRVREILAQELPGVPVMLSSDILPEIGEWVRTSATVLSAYVYSRTAAYLTKLARWLSDGGLSRPLLIMKLNGGCAPADQVLEAPVNIIASGPAAAPVAARHIARRLDAADAITVDMGGTSFDVCLMRHGEIPLSRDEFVNHQPLGVPAVATHSIGAGGGSIAWVDSGGALRVGPRSAGARPGPAAYGQGGMAPTVTDANVVLGYLSADAFLAGRRRLRPDLAAEAISELVAKPLGLDDVVEAAAGVTRIVDEDMVGAIRTITVERGVDPRPCVLVCGGGAGALHAGSLAAALGIERVLIPSQAGTLSAFGMTVTDVRYDRSATHHTRSDQVSWSAVATVLEDLEKQVVAELARSGFAPEDMRIERSVDARYVGQLHELTTPMPGDVDGAAALDTLAANFHRLHVERYSYSLDSPVEYLHWRVAGIGQITRRDEMLFAAIERVPGHELATGRRPAYFCEAGTFLDTAIYASAHMTVGATVDGPAIVESSTTTIVVRPGQTLIADGRGGYLLETNAARAGAIGAEPAGEAVGAGADQA